MLSNTFKISKGHNLFLEGKPTHKIIEIPSSKKNIIHPMSIKGIKTKLLIKEKENVKLGTPLFYDKRNKDALFISTCSGTISKIVIGERRIVEAIHIENDQNYETIDFPRAVSKSTLLKTGFWTFFRQRPFSKVPNPDVKPRSIFVSMHNTDPFSLDLETVLSDH